MRVALSSEGEHMGETETREVLSRILIANDGEVLTRLRLSAAEAARVCNVTPRQLIYWTKKGLVKASAEGDHDYDVYAMEKVIRIRQALAKGYSLEKAAQLVQRDIATLQSEVKRLDDLSAEELEDELRRRLEKLEERVAQLRRSLPATLSLARLRRATARRRARVRDEREDDDRADALGYRERQRLVPDPQPLRLEPRTRHRGRPSRRFIVAWRAERQPRPVRGRRGITPPSARSDQAAHRRDHESLPRSARSVFRDRPAREAHRRCHRGARPFDRTRAQRGRSDRRVHRHATSGSRHVLRRRRSVRRWEDPAGDQRRDALPPLQGAAALRACRPRA